MPAFIQRELFRKLTVIFAFSYALAGLVLFTDLFLLFMLGHSVRFEEPNPVIAAVEFASAILSAVILLLLMFQTLKGKKESLEETGDGEKKAFSEERITPLSAD